MKKTFIITGFIALFVAAFMWSLPEPIDNDLSKIGMGQKSVVFIYDLNLVVSNQQTIEINAAKAELGDTVNFLVSRTGYPTTDEFIKKYKAKKAELFFFDEGGEVFMRRLALVESEDLKMILASVD